MFFQKKKTEILNKKSCDGFISYRALHSKRRIPSPVFAVKKNVVPGKIAAVLGEVFSVVGIFAEKSKIFLNDYLYLIFKSAAHNHLRIQQCKVRSISGESCNLSFGSYTELKKYQKKLRLFTFSTSSTIASVLILMVVAQLFFPGVKSQGATFGWLQTDWVGGQDVASASHANNQTGWNKYSVKDAELAITNGGADLQLSSIAGSKVQTNDVDFKAGSSLDTTVVGEGSAASVKIGKEAVQISSSNSHTLVLKNDGTVWAWGNNGQGQLGDNTVTQRNTPVQVLGSGGSGFLTGIIAVAAGNSHSLALKSDGTVWAWGYNAQGQLGDNTLTQRNTPVQVLGAGGTGFLTGVSAFASINSSSSSLVVKNDGTVWGWGRNAQGQLGDNTVTNRSTPVQVLDSAGTGFLTGVTAVAVNTYHSLAIKSDGTVWAWGYNSFGQLGDNTLTQRNTPVQVLGVGGTGFLTGVTAVAAGNNHSLALKSDGTVWAWGYNAQGQLGDNTVTQRNTPVQVLGSGGFGFLTGITSISAGGYHSLVLKNDSTVWGWGQNTEGQLGNNTVTSRSTPVQVLGSGGVGFLTGIISISAGGFYSLVLKNDSTVWAWGHNSYGQLGDNTMIQKNTPVRTSGTISGYLTEVSTAVSAAHNKIANGDFHSLAIKNDGTVWAWGRNFNGQLGDGSYVDQITPLPVVGLADAVAVAAGPNHSLALKGDGTVWAWGYNGFGQLGDNTLTQRNTPVQVLGAGGAGFLTGVSAIATVGDFSLALKGDGTVWAWGNNGNGQLGDNTVTWRGVPIQVLGNGGAGFLTGITAIAAGIYHSLAVKNDGTVWAWGQNAAGQLGDNTLTQRNAPVQVLGAGGAGFLTGAVAVRANINHSLVLKNDGTVWSWGGNNSGQLGDNTMIQRNTPVQVLGVGGAGFLAGITAILSGNSSSIALKNDGTVWGWGYNGNGQLGDNTATQRNTPVQVLGAGGTGFLTGIVAVAANRNNAMAIKNDGTVWSWGSNNAGQLGDNTLTTRTTPVQVKVWNFPTDYLSVGAVYKAAGTFISQVLDMGQKSAFSSFAYAMDVPLGAAITVDVRSGNAASPDGSWSAWETGLASGGDISTHSGNQYFQYRLNFSSDGINAPQFNDVTVPYAHYFSSPQRLVSSAYNTNDPTNLLANIKWAENLPTDTNVKFQLRTAPDNAGAPDWAAGSGWCGPTNCASTKVDTDYSADFYQTTPTGETSNPLHISGNDDQWVQYATWLETGNTAFTPTLSDITLTYVVNITPQIQNVTASQGADGKVVATFEVRDGDTTSGATNGNVFGGLQYCTANCQAPGGETWADASTLVYKNSLGNILPSNVLAIDESVYRQYSISWDPKIDYNEHYNANIKIRVSANDSEAANNFGYGNSNSFVLDTKNPTNVGVVIDHSKSTNNLSLTVPADELGYQIAYSNYADFRDVTFESFPLDNKKTYNNLTQDPATVYVRVVDEKGNYTDSSSTTPAQPKNVVYYDTSNSLSNEYREFIAWSPIGFAQVGAGFESYEIYRAERLESDSGAAINYALLSSIANRNVNFLTDLSLNNAKHYYYKIFVKDVAGNVSEYSSVVEDNPNGQGGTDQTPPTLAGVTITDINTTSAKISWSSDELSDSSVGYSENVTYLPERGLASMVTDHEIMLTNLKPNTTYNIRIKSRDPVGNLGQNDKDNPGATPIQNFTFSTLPGPAISGVTIPNVSNTQATIDWKTTTDSSSYVVYSDMVSNGALVNPKEFGTPDLVGNRSGEKYSHSQTISTYDDLPLIPNTRYYFYVKSVDSESNISIDSNGGSFYELLTTQDIDPPVISNIQTPLITKDGVAISWTTDEPATGRVIFGTNSGGSYGESQVVSTYDRSHYIILSNLDPDKKYHFKLISTDINTNESAPTDEQIFSTIKDVEFQHDPLKTITFADLNPSILSDIVAVISFDSDQGANCFVEYGTEAGNLSAVPAKEGKDIFNKGHNIQLNGLVFSAKYFYKVTCQDNLGTVVSSDEKEFITKEQYFTAAGAGALGDHTPPVITNVRVSAVTGESAMVSWDSDEKASSAVGYGVVTVDENGATDQLINKSKDNFAAAHTVILNGLIPATRYIFVASSTDAAGNISQSAESTFTTASPSSLSSIKVESKNLGEASITWQTSADTTSIVEYGLTTSYGEKKESATLTKDHVIDLSNLNQGVTYHYRVKGKDKDGRLFASSDQTFEPKSPAQITEISINDISEHGAVVTFKTNVPTDAQVSYTDIRDNQATGAQGIRELTTEHRVELNNLAQGTTFAVSVSAKDEQGTESTIKAPDFTTGQDQQPPRIENIKTDSALTQSDKVQAIISWKTDEQATTSILYREGRNGDEKEIKITDNLTTGHVGVVTIFKPGTVYNFKVKSIDATGNVAISNDFALLTPRKRENIIQIIIGNFTDIFGWAKF